MTKNIAIISGASSGLGEEFLKQTYAENFDEYWLIARRKERLEELSANYPKSRILSYDLTDNQSIEDIKKILDEDKPCIKLLVNSAGSGKTALTSEMDYTECVKIINLNCSAVVSLTQICLPYMAKDSRIINVASIAGFQPIPGLNIYAASKAFVLSYSKALHYELKNKGIKVTALCPYWIKDTEFIGKAEENTNKSFKSYPFATTKAKVVKRALKYNKENLYVATPDFISCSERILTKIIPDEITVYIMDGVRKL